jgi:preprotein translocase SecE subunit
MLRFFYDSLETVKKITFPKTNDFINLSIAIFIAVIIAGAFFAGADYIVYSLLRLMYGAIRGNPAEVLE